MPELFVCPGHKSLTPDGPGTWLQMFAARRAVLSGQGDDAACVRFLRSEVMQVTPELAA